MCAAEWGMCGSTHAKTKILLQAILLLYSVVYHRVASLPRPVAIAYSSTIGMLTLIVELSDVSGAEAVRLGQQALHLDVTQRHFQNVVDWTERRVSYGSTLCSTGS